MAQGAGERAAVAEVVAVRGSFPRLGFCGDPSVLLLLFIDTTQVKVELALLDACVVVVAFVIVSEKIGLPVLIVASFLRCCYQLYQQHCSSVFVRVLASFFSVSHLFPIPPLFL